MASIKSETQQFQDEKDQLESELGGLKETVNKTKQTVRDDDRESGIRHGSREGWVGELCSTGEEGCDVTSPL